VVYNVNMRTTITMDEETAKIAAQYAHSRGVSLSKAISELIQRGTRPRARIKYVNGWPVFDLPKSGKPITTEHVKMLEDDEL
jgi:hypothetical protein